MLRILTAAAVAGTLLLQTASHAQSLEPPEMTTVSGRLMIEKETGAPAGAAYFVFQRRILEIPHENSLDALRDMAETTVAVDEGGSFSLRMAPGNYLMVYEPQAPVKPELVEGGPNSFAKAKQLTPEQRTERIERIKENAQKGVPIQGGKIGEAHVVENRFIRPPLTDFGEILLGDSAVVTVRATGPDEKELDFPLALRMRGKSGDIYEPHPPTVSERGTFVFHDVFPQSYQVFALPSRPAPGQGDEVTTPSVANSDLLYTGEPLEWTVEVDPTPVEPTPKMSEATDKEKAAEKSAVPRKKKGR